MASAPAAPAALQHLGVRFLKCRQFLVNCCHCCHCCLCCYCFHCFHCCHSSSSSSQSEEHFWFPFDGEFLWSFSGHSSLVCRHDKALLQGRTLPRGMRTTKSSLRKTSSSLAKLPSEFYQLIHAALSKREGMKYYTSSFWPQMSTFSPGKEPV